MNKSTFTLFNLMKGQGHMSPKCRPENMVSEKQTRKKLLNYNRKTLIDYDFFIGVR